jgi:hypothetical protein
MRLASIDRYRIVVHHPKAVDWPPIIVSRRDIVDAITEICSTANIAQSSITVHPIIRKGQ